jgi:hypothetical protein
MSDRDLSSSSGERAAFLMLSGWGGVGAYPCVVIGETPRKYRILAGARIKLAGRKRWLEAGQATLVPKHAIRFAEKSNE